MKFHFSKWWGKIFLREHNAFSSVPHLTINNDCSLTKLKLSGVGVGGGGWESCSPPQFGRNIFRSGNFCRGNNSLS